MTYRTLGINPGHNGSVALIVDGKIAVSYTHLTLPTNREV